MNTRQPPNVLIYFIDELRADVLGCYGHPQVQTPALDRIANQGVRFNNAFSNCPLCMPARNCFFLSQYPSTHGVTCNGPLSQTAKQNPPTSAFGQVLRDAGYERIVNIGKHHTGYSTAVSGFTEHHSTPDRLGTTATKLSPDADPQQWQPIYIPGEAPNTIIGGTYAANPDNTHAAQSIDAAISCVDAFSQDAPWVLRFSVDTPHTPVLPPKPYDTMYADHNDQWRFDDEEFASRSDLLQRWSRKRGFTDLSVQEQRRARNSYLGLTAYLDTQIARLEEHLEQQGLAENLITIVVADHGASIGDHGCQVKGPFDTDDIARVPMIIRYPNHIQPRVCNQLTQIMDIVPTLADLLHVQTPSNTEGKSLLPILNGDTENLHEAIFMEGDFPHGNMNTGMRESIRTPEWLYTRYTKINECELFDLANNPQQTQNVADQHPEIVDTFNARLDAWRADHPVPANPASAAAT
jgi:arylsulfatase A-like enzyme